MKNKSLLVLASSFIVIPLSFGCGDKPSENNNCTLIKNSYKKYVYDNTNIDDYIYKPTNRIKEELGSKTIGGVETYYFKNIDYSIDNVRSSWDAANHLSRTLKIAISAEERNEEELREVAKKLTYHWVFSNYHNINWWQNELGANSTLANLGLFTFDYLGKKGQDAFNGKIRESSLKYRPSVSTHTGANVFDYIDITCRDAAINNDREEMDIAFNRLAEEITNDKVEGFQKDGSFFQHGRQVQNVSYGKSIVRVGKTLYHLGKGNYKLSDDKMTILVDYILNGIRDSTFKGYTNYTTVSREYSRVDNLDTKKSGLGELSYYLGLNSFPKDRIDEMYDFIYSLNNRKVAVTKDDIKYFPIAKMIVANIGHDDTHEGVYISYKATEPNLTNTECVNGENQLGLNLSYGTNTCVMDKGDEYLNIAPVMNYNYMPGTTSVFYGDKSSITSQDSEIKHYAVDVYGDSLYEHKVPAATLDNKFIYNDGQNDDVTYSMTRTKHHDRASYTVSCFATKEGMVLVGSDFSYVNLGEKDKVDTKMHTTVDQYVTSDNVSEEKSSLSFENHVDGNINYKSLTDQKLVKKIENKQYTGESWKRNNRDLKTSDSGSKNVATITIEGDDIKSYAYAIQPKNVTKEFKLASNSNGVHAIKLPNGKIAACFYNKDASFTFEDKTYKLEDQSKFEVGKGAFVLF